MKKILFLLFFGFFLQSESIEAGLRKKSKKHAKKRSPKEIERIEVTSAGMAHFIKDDFIKNDIAKDQIPQTLKSTFKNIAIEVMNEENKNDDDDFNSVVWGEILKKTGLPIEDAMLIMIKKIFGQKFYENFLEELQNSENTEEKNS